MLYLGPRWRFCVHHQREEFAIDFGFSQAPEYIRCGESSLRFRCGCAGWFTEGCRPYITLRCAGHYRTTFSEVA